MHINVTKRLQKFHFCCHFISFLTLLWCHVSRKAKKWSLNTVCLWSAVGSGYFGGRGEKGEYGDKTQIKKLLAVAKSHFHCILSGTELTLSSVALSLAVIIYSTSNLKNILCRLLCVFQERCTHSQFICGSLLILIGWLNVLASCKQEQWWFWWRY